MKRGSKQEPLCGYCSKPGHYRSSCPSLAQELLKAATKHASVDQLQTVLRKGQPLKLNVPPRRDRTLKRARGKRFRAPPRKNANVRKKKTRKVKAKKRNRDAERMRKPRAKKKELKKYTLKEVNLAWKNLRKTGWLQKPPSCGQCENRLIQCPLKDCVKRGAGRMYYRCSGCRKWYDALAFSALPILKLPLPLILAAMKRYFHGPSAESVESAATALGLSASAKTSALARLWMALRTAENRCMDARQNSRTLTGLNGFVVTFLVVWVTEYSISYTYTTSVTDVYSLHSAWHIRRLGSRCYDDSKVEA